MSSTQARKAAPRIARPANRYWRGQAPKGVAAVDSSSESEDEVPDETPQDVPLSGDYGTSDGDDDEKPLPVSQVTKERGKEIHVKLKDVNISESGRVIVGGREESGRTLLEQKADSDEEEDEEEEIQREPAADDESSSEYETDSEEEVKPAVLFRPVFVPKRGRQTVAEREEASENTEEAWKKKEAAAAERKKQSHDLVSESIKRELAEKETPDLIPDVDDTDGIDPTAEFEAWKLRELARIKRDKELSLQKEREREEVERRRAMPEEQRLKEDLESAQKSREEKPKGQQKFLQKFWHKGAFHQDAEILKRHDFTEATESTIDKTILPKAMQVKNFGMRSQTKYTHLLDQDTTVSNGGFGGAGKSGGKGPGGSMSCFNCGGPHLKKDCPQLAGLPPSGDGKFRTGSNNDTQAPTRTWGHNRPYEQGKEKETSWRDRDEDSGWRHRHEPSDRDRNRRDDEKRYRGEGHDRRRDDYNRGPRRRSRSRSRSPPRKYSERKEEDGHRIRRPRSRSRDSGERDQKRRKEYR